MNAQSKSTKLYLALSLLLLVVMGLAGCGNLEAGAVPAEASSANASEGDEAGAAKSDDAPFNGIEIGIEPTPMPAMLTYTNDFYGFKFSYPETWTLKEEDHGIVLQKGANRLSVHFRWVNEAVPPFRTGMAAGTKIYSDKLTFLGQVAPVYVVELDHLAKYVLYGESGVIEVDDLVFTSVLEDLETDYVTLDLPEVIITEAKTIMDSFERIPATGSNPAVAPTQEPTPTAPEPVTLDTSVYENREYGFTFLYPSSYTVIEEPNKVLVLDQGNCQMTIAYRRADEEVQIAGSSDVSGQLVSYHEIQFLDHTVGSYLNIQDDLISSAYLGSPGIELGEGTPLRVAVSMENIEGRNLANAQVDMMLTILESFALVSD